MNLIIKNIDNQTNITVSYLLRICLRLKGDEPVVIVGKLAVDKLGQVVALEERLDFL